MYEIYFQDELVFTITKKGGDVHIYQPKFLPFDIYLEESDDFDDRINNLVNFKEWCAGRILNIDRVYRKEILNYYGFSQNLSSSEQAQIGIATRCLSLNDCFWLKSPEEPLSWKDVNLFDNSLENSIFEPALTGKYMTITNSKIITPELVTDGVAPKAWIRKGTDFYLLKGEQNDSVKREVEASQILNLLGLSVTSYEQKKFQKEPVSVCKCFTTKHIHFVRAMWYQIWCENHDIPFISIIHKYKESFDKMNLADYLIGNTDEHAENWGFLYDDNMQILQMNPPMDYDHAFLGEENSICLPMQFIGQRMTQEAVAKQIISKYPNWLSFDVDLSAFQYGSFVEKRLQKLKQYLQEHSCFFNNRTDDITEIVER